MRRASHGAIFCVAEGVLAVILLHSQASAKEDASILCRWSADQDVSLQKRCLLQTSSLQGAGRYITRSAFDFAEDDSSAMRQWQQSGLNHGQRQIPMTEAVQSTDDMLEVEDVDAEEAELSAIMDLQMLDGYEALAGDCAGNNLENISSITLAKCAKKCSELSACAGFSYNKRFCLPKSMACDGTVENGFTFYKKKVPDAKVVDKPKTKPKTKPKRVKNATSDTKDEKEEMTGTTTTEPSTSSDDKEEKADSEDDGNKAFEPDHGSCNPACTWKCVTPTCEQICEPTCKPPKCETRCEALNTSGCVMDCHEPTCYTVCPKKMCEHQKCAPCKTTCSNPECRLKCPQRQKCKSVCQTPSCDWHCIKPSICPAAQCKLVCDQPSKCRGKGGVHEKLPGLKKGEFKVGSFEAPLNMFPNAADLPKSAERMEISPTKREDKKTWEVVSDSTGVSGCVDCAPLEEEAGMVSTIPVTVERSPEEELYPQSDEVHMPVL